jgi:hypothetical protein
VADTREAIHRANQEAKAAEAEWCLQQRLAARSYPQIAAVSQAEFGRHIPQTTAYKRVQWALKKWIGETAEEVRQVELAKLDELELDFRRVKNTEHVKVAGGTIVRDENGVPLIDDSPVLAAGDRLLKIQERRARLLGIDAPERVAATTTVRYEVVGVDIGALT